VTSGSNGRSSFSPTRIRLFATAVVLVDVVACTGWYEQNVELHALVGLIGVLLLSGGANPDLQLNFQPQSGWGYWLRIGCLWGIGILFLCLLGAIVCMWNGWEIPIPKSPPSLQYFVFMCISAPVSEEIIYRALFVIAFRPSLGDWGTVITGGFLFAAIHQMNGNPGIDNQVAGFLLIWAFLKSRSLLVPLAMHSGGNFFAFLVHSAAWYWTVLQGPSQ